MRIRFKIFAAVAMILIPVLLSGCSSGISLGSSDAAIGLIIDNSADQTPVNTPHVSSEPPETKAGNAFSYSADMPKPSGYISILVNVDNQLDEIFIPSNLARIRNYINPELLTLRNEDEMANREAVEALKDMLTEASFDGITGFYLEDAYRTYREQLVLWEIKQKESPGYGSDLSVPLSTAYPSASEHLTGLAFDLGACGSGVIRDFNSEQGQWLISNAHRFGFIHRYPDEKADITGIIFEPWHFRYVGEDIASYIYDNRLTLEEYYSRLEPAD